MSFYSFISENFCSFFFNLICLSTVNLDSYKYLQVLIWFSKIQLEFLKGLLRSTILQ